MEGSFLNRAQRRAQTTMMLLRNHDRHHVEQFLDGIAANEPPQYQLLNGKVAPPFSMVTMKENASGFDLGNVKMEDGRVVHITYRIVNTRPQKEVTDALRYDGENELTVPIPVAVANELVDAWITQYESFARRMKAINEARTYVLQMLEQKPYIVVNRKSGDGIGPIDAEMTPNRKENPEASAAGPSTQPITITGAGKRPMEDVNGSIAASKRQKTMSTRAREEKTIISRFHQASEVLFPGIVPLIEQVNKTLVTYEGVGSPFQCLHKDMQELKNKLKDLLNADTLEILGKRPMVDFPAATQSKPEDHNAVGQEDKTSPRSKALNAFLAKQKQKKEAQTPEIPEAPSLSVKARSDQAVNRPPPTPKLAATSSDPKPATTSSDPKPAATSSNPKPATVSTVMKPPKASPVPEPSNASPTPKPATASPVPSPRPRKIVNINKLTDQYKPQVKEVFDLTSSDNESNEFPRGTVFKVDPDAVSASNVTTPRTAPPTKAVPQAEMFAPATTRPRASPKQNRLPPIQHAPTVRPISLGPLRKRMEEHQRQQRQQNTSNPQAPNAQSTVHRYNLSPPSPLSSQRASRPVHTADPIQNTATPHTPPPSYTALSEYTYSNHWAPMGVGPAENDRLERQSRHSTSNSRLPKGMGSG